MSIIRFRFRSAVNFDSVDIGEGKHSISARDLKSKIVLNKNLNLCQDFDLLLSDALTGREYCDENNQVPAGSSVIIKRVPKGAVHSDIGRGETSENVRIKDGIYEIKTASTSLNLEDNFDDFGAELCPSLEATISGSGLNADNKLQFTINETTNEVTRCFETPLVGYQKPEASGLSEATPRGPLCIDGNLDLPGTKSKSSVVEYAKPKMVVTANRQDIEIGCLPAELKCSLCDTFFKDAVMIPCCQHSFCEKCIGLVLIEKGRCPKCLSTKYKVEDLLPNVSLRQAIKHFLESQSLIRSSDNAFGYAPDGESGIQVKEMSCAVSIQQREAEPPHSPCTTGQGSNQIISNAIGGKSSFSPKLRKIDAEKHGSMHSVFSSSWPENSAADFQAESTIKKRVLHVQTTGAADMSFVETGRYRKRDRTCFMCGSPDHLIRDCPAASSPHVMIQTGNSLFSRAAPGYMPPFYNGAPFHQISPFANPYGAHFNATMVPPANYVLPTYMPPMYGGMAAYRGSTTIVGTAFTGPEWHLGLSDCQERAGYEKRQKLAHDNLLRGKYLDDDDKDSYDKRGHSYEIDRLDHPRFYRDREGSGSHSKISSTERPHKKHRRHYHYDDELERSSSEVEDMPSSSNKHSEEQHKYQHRNIKERDSDSSLNHHRSTKSKDAKRKSGSDVKRDKQKRHGRSGSGLEPCLSIHQKRERKDKDSGHSSRHSKHRSKSAKNKQIHERWKMVSGSDEDLEDDNHYHNGKRHY